MGPKRPPPIAVPEPVSNSSGLPVPAGASPTMLTSSAAAAVMASKDKASAPQPATDKGPATNHKVTVTSPPNDSSAKKAAKADDHKPASPQSLSIADRKRVLWIMCLLKVITSYDSGAYGAVLGIDDGIAQALQLSVVDEGALGSAPFIGNTIGCAVAGVLFSQYEAKPMLLFGMGMHFTSTILFALAPSFIVALLSRVLIGFTLSFVVVYSVVWTDVFAPQQYATTWLAAMNAGVPLGMLLGFIMGGSVIPELELSWRLTFVFKAIVLLPLLVMLKRTPPSHVNDPGATQAHRQSKLNNEKHPSTCQSIARNSSTLLRNELFVCAVAGLVVLYFVVTAMQVFITSYLRGPPFYASMTTIVFGFGVTSVTAPVFGVVTGGVILDRLGGYQTNLRRAALFGAACGTGAAWFGLLACYMTTVPTFIAALWFMLFVGAANVPVGTGILMASVPPSMRPTASAYAAVAFNVFGYFLGPIFCGFVADQTGSLAQAFHIVLMMSGVGCIPLGLTVIFAAHHRPPQTDADYEAERDSSVPRPDEVSTPTVVDAHSSQMVMTGSFVVSVPSTPARTPQQSHAATPFDRSSPPAMAIPPAALE